MSLSHSPPQFRTLPPVIKAVLIINVIGFLGMTFAGPFLMNTLALTPARVTGSGWLWQLVTYGFLHASFFHLLFNMFAVWMFGREIEVRMGSIPFLVYYLVTTLGASLTQVAIEPHSLVPSLGASGAVYGLLAAFAVLFPEAVVYLYFLIPLTAKQLVLLFGVLEFLAGATGSTFGVANFAHLGGLLTGLVYLKAPAWFRGSLESIRENHEQRLDRKKLREEEDTNQEVDRILEKVLREGAGSLTPKEHAIMKKYSSARTPRS